jgi:hypothetical protein
MEQQQIRLQGKDQDTVNVLREELGAVMVRAEELQALMIHTALTFAGIPRDEWMQWEVGMGIPTTIRRRAENEEAPPVPDLIGEEVIEDE